MNDHLEQGLRELLDKDQIETVVLRYQRALDRRDLALMQSCFWPGATVEYGDKPFLTGTADDFIDRAMGTSSPRGDRPALHGVLSSLIELDGDVACVESPYVILIDSTPSWEQGDLQYIVVGRYLDRFHRRDDVWKILNRSAVHDFSRISLPVATPDMFAVGLDGEGGMTVGTKDKTDLSYTWFSSLPPVGAA
jgi:hypothetical protein